MKSERRQLTIAELAAITSSRPVVRRIPPPPNKDVRTGAKGLAAERGAT